MEGYPIPAVERAMKVQEVILKAISGQLQWWQAAEILGVSCRTMRRWKARYQQRGYDGLLDRRRMLFKMIPSATPPLRTKVTQLAQDASQVPAQFPVGIHGQKVEHDATGRCPRKIQLSFRTHGSPPSIFRKPIRRGEDYLSCGSLLDVRSRL